LILDALFKLLAYPRATKRLASLYGSLEPGMDALTKSLIAQTQRMRR
jgi:hypothetical protein